MKHVVKNAISLPIPRNLFREKIYQSISGVKNVRSWLHSHQHGTQTVLRQTRLENANAAFEKHFPVTTLKGGILSQQFSFTLAAMITASSVTHMSP